MVGCTAMRCDGRIQQCHNITQYVMSCYVMITHTYTYTYTYWNGQDMLSGVRGHSDKYATGHFPEAQCAFKILMIHEVLQFALRIAFRCVLHRCGNLDIRCWKLYKQAFSYVRTGTAAARQIRITTLHLCTVLYCTVLYYTVLYRTILHMFVHLPSSELTPFGFSYF